MQWRGRVATVLYDTGNPGLDGRHWVFVELESLHPAYEAWRLHVPREELH